MTSFYKLMSYSVLYRNEEELFNDSMIPDPDPHDLRGQQKNGYTPYCGNKSIGALVFGLRARSGKHADPSAQPSWSHAGARIIMISYNYSLLIAPYKYIYY